MRAPYERRIIVQVVRLIFTWKMEVLIARVIDMFYVGEGKVDGMMMNDE